MYLTLNLLIVINFSLITAQNATTQRQPPSTSAPDPPNRCMYIHASVLSYKAV